MSKRKRAAFSFANERKSGTQWSDAWEEETNERRSGGEAVAMPGRILVGRYLGAKKISTGRTRKIPEVVNEKCTGSDP